MEVLISMLIAVGATTADKAPTLSQDQIHVLQVQYDKVLWATFGEEYGRIIGIDPTEDK